MGMSSLVDRLKEISRVQVDVFGWRDNQRVYDQIISRPDTTKIALIGYSLGANSITQIAKAISRKIELLVAYDPSNANWQGKDIMPLGDNVARAICYRGTLLIDPLGHGRLIFSDGRPVETLETAWPHVTICYNQYFHNRTVRAVYSL